MEHFKRNIDCFSQRRTVSIQAGIAVSLVDSFPPVWDNPRLSAPSHTRKWETCGDSKTRGGESKSGQQTYSDMRAVRPLSLTFELFSERTRSTKLHQGNVGHDVHVTDPFPE